MANNWPGAVDRVLGAALSEFGEAVTFTPATGPALAVSGVFNNVWREIDAASGLPVSSNQPNLGIRLSDFPTPPIEGDKFLIRLATFRVVDVQEDGEGGAKCLLHKEG